MSSSLQTYQQKLIKLINYSTHLIEPLTLTHMQHKAAKPRESNQNKVLDHLFPEDQDSDSLNISQLLNKSQSTNMNELKAFLADLNNCEFSKALVLPFSISRLF